MDVKRYIPALQRGSIAFEALLVATTAATTALITYKIASKRVGAEYAQRIDDELEATRKFYAAFHEKPTPAELVEDVGLEPADEDEKLGEATEADKIISQYLGKAEPGDPAPVQYHRVEPKEDASHGPAIQLNLVVEPPTQNIFESGESTESVPQELVDSRSEDRPYIISQDEFTQSEYGQDTFTYYGDDGVLADSQDMPVDNVEHMLGEANVQQFGVGSGDPRVVYIRNDKLGMDFEIVANPGNYGQIVHGIEERDREESRRRRSPRDE